MEKIRSSRKLKESMENIEKVLENEAGIDPVVAIDPVLADAYLDDQQKKEEVAYILDELDKKAEEIKVEEPESPMPVDNTYTKQLTLDESFKDFTISEDLPKTRISARDDNDTDKYLDYDMSEFIYEMFSAGSKGITNIAPKRPLAKQEKKVNGVKTVGLYPVKGFSPNGSQVNHREYIALFDLSKTCSRDVSMGIKKLPKDVLATAEKYAEQSDTKEMGALEAFELFTTEATPAAKSIYNTYKNKFKDPKVDEFTYINDLLGYTFISFTKDIGTPQIGQAGYDTVLYANSVETLELAREGAASYHIECGPVAPRKNTTSHWEYSMVVYCPTYEDGMPMMLEDFLEENGFELDDVFEPAVARAFKNAFKADAIDAKYLEDKAVIDELIDTYSDKAMDIDPEDDEAMEALFADMCTELAAKKIKCTQNIRDRFADETGYMPIK